MLNLLKATNNKINNKERYFSKISTIILGYIVLQEKREKREMNEGFYLWKQMQEKQCCKIENIGIPLHFKMNIVNIFCIKNHFKAIIFKIYVNIKFNQSFG